jgi:RsiW-degrading membrane proteinase PrsW (M82 family)
MLISVGALLISFIPAVLFYFWFRKMKKEDLKYQEVCKAALKTGLLTTVPVGIVAIALYLIALLLGLKDQNEFIREAYQDFVLAALTEEFFKFYMFRRTLKQNRYAYSWKDLIVFMTIVGMGFGFLESILYMFQSNAIQILVRGLLLMHGGYGFIMGYFYGKAKYTGKKFNYVIAFLLPYLLHGAYDFTLSEGIIEIYGNVAFVPVTLALIGLITVIIMIVFFAKRSKKEKYSEPLAEYAVSENAAETA